MIPARTIKKLAVVLLTLGLFSTSLAQGLSRTSCGEDNHISAAQRQAIDAAALHFVRTLLGSNPWAAYNLMSTDGRQKVPNAHTLQQAATALEHFKPKHIKVQHTYDIHILGSSPGRVVCATDLSKSEGWVSVVAANVPEQAYVVLSAQAINNQFAYTIWLVPESGVWKVQRFHSNIATLGSETSDQLWKRARAQKAKGHDFNAALLYVAALQTASRGPNFQMGIDNPIAEEMSQLPLPPEIKGRPPYHWKSPGMTFQVLSFGPIAVGGKIYVIIRYISPVWSSDSQVNGWNKKLIAYVKTHFPEYSDVFAGIVVRAHEKGTRQVFGTVSVVPPTSK